ncbi:hypothetical protein RHSIM_Rhsim12G0045000 [Rhododendron simsii]|uniref:C2 domain-containing protein n=1 Tax=Rhododendron simsii TaxID=118357 RepID=A0A834G6H8_RHOSS|nr:hypothetical protein RHSIM_Rhsim12G0045000 [Rhododendron simsii]
MQRPPPMEDFALKETKPYLGGANFSGDKLTSTYDLVEEMQYLYVRVVEAKDLPGKDATGSCDPYIEVKVGNCKGTTRYLEKKLNPEWNQVFAFSKVRLKSHLLEVTVKDKDVVKDDFLGRVLFELKEVPRRVPPDSPLAPQWYMLEDRRGNKAIGELMLAVWMGKQADEAFPEAWSTDALNTGADRLANIRSKVYLSPKLWYLRVNVIEAQDLMPGDETRFPEVFVKAILGNQALRTGISMSKNTNVMWNEDLLFVAAEPFDEPLNLSVEDRVAPNTDEVLGRCAIPLDHEPSNSRWYNLEKHIIVDGEKKKEIKFGGRLHVSVCLEGGDHVLDESTHYRSDLRRPTSIGVLKLGIIDARGLSPMKTKDGKETTYPYCVAKYGQKWVRTRTITDSFSPEWNEQYNWEVLDPFTVITIGVFDNCDLGGGDKNGGAKDSKMGKVRIRLSTLETNRVYTHLYPLLVWSATGVKKMGEIHLAVRFSRSSLLNMMHTYAQPLLPNVHYIHPLTVAQLDSLRHYAAQIVSMRLSRVEPPLREEVVEYMLDAGSHMWNMRRSKANFFRIMNGLSVLFAVGKWFDQICSWKKPITTVLIHVLFLIVVLYPKLILPTIFLCLFLIGVWNYRSRYRHPPHTDIRLSFADNAPPDELEEEFDTFPTSCLNDTVRARYDRLRKIAGRIEIVMHDIATQGERLQSLLSWQDPRLTALFYISCLVAAIVLYVTPFQVVALLAGFYVLRHPRFRYKLPSVPLNLFRRLPARTDCML